MAEVDPWGQGGDDEEDDLLDGNEETNKGDDVFDEDDETDGDDDMNDNNGGNGKGNTPKGDDSGDLTDQQKLQLAERANEIYRQQLKYMQDHLASLRALIQDKENIIENLMLRYDLGIISQDQNKNGNVNSDDIDHEELRRKAEALAQRTILENFELREMVNELRDENFHLRNEIYELQDKINRQVLQINKLEKQVEQQAKTIEENEKQLEKQLEKSKNDKNDDDDDGGAMKEPDNDVENQMGRRASKTWDHPANAPDARAKRLEREEKRHQKKTSLYAPKDLFPSNDASEDESVEEKYMDEEAKKKKEERANHARKESATTPNIFGSTPLQVDSDDEEIKKKRAEREERNKRRDSVKVPDIFGQQNSSDDDDPNKPKKTRDSENEDDHGNDTDSKGTKLSKDAIEKRKARQEKHHRRKSSMAAPNIFSDKYDIDKQVKIEEQKNSEEANAKREDRKKKKGNKHKKSESIVYQELFLNKEERENFGDDSRQTLSKRKEQRRKSKQLLAKHVGDKGHLSDEDVNNPKFAKKDKPRRYDYDMKKEKRKAARNNNEPNDVIVSHTGKRASLSGAAAMIGGDNETSSHHRRDSSAPVVNMGFEDPDVLLHFEQLKVKDLEQELAKRNDEFDLQTQQMKDLHDRITTLEAEMNEKSNVVIDTKSNENDEIIVKLREQKQKYEKINEENEYQLRHEEKKNKEIYDKLEESKDALNEAITTKASLASRCSSEIMRLSAIINQLLEIPHINESVQLLINESFKSKTYQMSQQDY